MEKCIKQNLLLLAKHSQSPRNNIINTSQRKFGAVILAALLIKLRIKINNLLTTTIIHLKLIGVRNESDTTLVITFKYHKY